MVCKIVLLLTILILTIETSVAPPVTEKKKDDIPDQAEFEDNLPDTLEYKRYLKEVLQVLESDPEFRSKLEKVDTADIHSGKIADELQFVNHNIRSKLDEIKRTELERLRHLAIQQFEMQNGLDTRHLKISEHVQKIDNPKHLDHRNIHTFEGEDLRKLIAETTKHLQEAEEKRKEEFRKYEMAKEFEHEQKMKALNEEERKKFEEEFEEQKKKHKKHEPLHHPGSKKQLEEVWEKQDHMENQEFDPKIFFVMHDLDGNGVWDETEVKALFLKELDKLYREGHPEDDIIERREEMERMREHVFKEADLNGDKLISYEEFIAQSNKSDFEEDPGWKTLDEQEIYSKDEYDAYKREIEKQMHYQQPYDHPGGYQQFPPQHPNAVNPPQQAYVPQPQYQEIPQNYPQQVQYNNQIPNQNMQYQNQVPSQTYQGAEGNIHQPPVMNKGPQQYHDAVNVNQHPPINYHESNNPNNVNQFGQKQLKDEKASENQYQNRPKQQVPASSFNSQNIPTSNQGQQQLNEASNIKELPKQSNGPN